MLALGFVQPNQEDKQNNTEWFHNLLKGQVVKLTGN